MRKILSLIILLMLCRVAVAQIDSVFGKLTSLEPNLVIDVTDRNEYHYLKRSSIYDASDRLSIRIYGHSFFKNNEYFGDFVKGYTLPGFHFQPEITYNLNSQLSFQLMWNVLKYHGSEKYQEANPYFRIVFRPNKYFTVIGGYLEGNVKHDLVEPVYNPERYYLGTYPDRYFTRNVENGIQLKLDRQRYQGELWMNWENFILWGDDDQERFTVGHVSKFHVVNQSLWRADLVGEFIVAHRGGQIDSCDAQMQSLENGALGVDVRRFGSNGSNGGVFRQLSLRAMLVQYHSMSGTDDLPWDDGWGTYLKAHLRMWNFGLAAGHWYGHKFLSFRGDPLFSCWALEDENNKENRSMMFGELYFSKNYFDDVFTLRTGINAYYDIKASQLEYAYMLSMIVCPRITILPQKKSEKF